MMRMSNASGSLAAVHSCACMTLERTLARLSGVTVETRDVKQSFCLLLKAHHVGLVSGAEMESV